MKIHLLIYIFVWLFTCSTCFAQNNNVGIGTLSPSSSALLDIDASPANNKGVLVPRMTAIQRIAIPSPANSLLVFDTDSACFFYWNTMSSNWKSLCNSGSALGMTGSTGTTGSTGADGLTGVTGFTGSVGIAGAVGFTGATGSAGVGGTTGAIGSIGATGAAGVDLGTHWTTSGNAGTIAGTNFIGTTDATDLVIKTNATEKIRVKQTGNVGIGTATPDASALLDLDAGSVNGRGLLIPRLTTIQRNAIVSPALSLFIFNTTTNCFEAFVGGAWYSMSCPSTACTPPAAPTANAASGIGCTALIANWNTSSGASSYYLDVATDAGFTSFVSGYNNLNVGNVTSYSVTGLTAGTTYYYRLRAATTCTSGNSGTITTITTSATAQPSVINGTTPVCQGQSGVAYSVTNVGGVTYTWSYSGIGFTCTSGCTSNSITADFSGAATSGTLSVTPSNACGNGISQTFAITVSSSSSSGPATPGVITGNTPVTFGTAGVVYSIAPVAGATTYTWTVPACATITAGQGTTSITVTYTSPPTLLFTTSGTYTCNCITAASIIVIGGGGAGGNNAIGSGGGGGYSSGSFFGLTGASLSVTVGAGGIVSGGAGGTSNVDALISATGGGGGVVQDGVIGYGGAGGIGSGGSINRTGGTGGNSQYTYLGGGGGGAGGSASNGSNGGPPPIFWPTAGWDAPTNFGPPGSGGGGYAGNGGNGSCFNTYPTNIAATVPTNYGGGGGGGNGNGGASSVGSGGIVELSAVTYGGIISVTAGSACGTSSASSKVITINP